MNIFESLNQTSDKAVNVGEEYYTKTQEYYKLKVFQQLASTLGIFCKIFLIGSLLFIGLILLCVAATIALGEMIGNLVLACLIIALTLFFIGGITFLFRRKIDSVVVQKMSKQFFN